jgi:hypothetical protein
MKKILFACFILSLGLQTYAYNPGNSRASMYSTPQNENAISLQEFLNLTPKKYQQLTGKRMTWKQKLAFYMLKGKLKKQLSDNKNSHSTDIGLLSLIFGGSAFVLAIIPYVGLVSIPLAIAAIILGIIGLGRKKGDTKSIIGLVLGSVFLLLLLVLIAAFSSGWY